MKICPLPPLLRSQKSISSLEAGVQSLTRNCPSTLSPCRPMPCTMEVYRPRAPQGRHAWLRRHRPHPLFCIFLVSHGIKLLLATRCNGGKTQAQLKPRNSSDAAPRVSTCSCCIGKRRGRKNSRANPSWCGRGEELRHCCGRRRQIVNTTVCLSTVSSQLLKVKTSRAIPDARSYVLITRGQKA